MKALFIASLVLASWNAASAASPRYLDADAWRRDFSSAVDGNYTGALRENRAVMQRRLNELEARAEKLFAQAGLQFGVCIGAIQGYKAAFTAQVGHTSSVSDQSLSGQTRIAFEAGAKYSACRDAIDALGTAR